MSYSPVSQILTRVKDEFGHGENRRAHQRRDAGAEQATDRNHLDQYVPPRQRVNQILTEYEGYTWQGHITAETGWSASKTSRVLSDLEDEGHIVRRQVGRKKAVFLPDQVPRCVSDRNFTPGPHQP